MKQEHQEFEAILALHNDYLPPNKKGHLQSLSILLNEINT
jgi:hypothetical protein